MLSPRKLESLLLARVSSSPTSFLGEAPASDALNYFALLRQYTRPAPAHGSEHSDTPLAVHSTSILSINMSAVNPTSAFPPTDAQSSKGSLQAGSGASNPANVAKR